MNDIALLRLDTSPYNLERRAAAGHPTTPVPLCPAALQPEGRKCRVSGWGHLKSKGSGVPDKLREVEVKVKEGGLVVVLLLVTMTTRAFSLLKVPTSAFTIFKTLWVSAVKEGIGK